MSGSSFTVRKTNLTSGIFRLSCAQASMPLSPGIEMSSTITSGRVLGARSMSARPSQAVPTISHRGSSKRWKASRSIVWSSARRMRGRSFIGLVVFSRAASPLGEIIGRGDGDAHFDPGAFARVRLDGKHSMHEPRALAHADEAERAIAARRFRIETDAVIGDGEPKLAALHR